MDKDGDIDSAKRPHDQRASLRGLCISALIVVIAFTVRWFLDSQMGRLQPFAFFYMAVLVIAWWEGWKSATGAATAGLLLGWWFFVDARNSFRIEHPSDAIQIVTYCAVSIALVLLMNRAQRAERSAAALVRERTAALEAANERLRRQIVEHEVTEEGLRASEARFRLLVESVKDTPSSGLIPPGT